jgi:hypothetical protein
LPTTFVLIHNYFRGAAAVAGIRIQAQEKGATAGQGGGVSAAFRQITHSGDCLALGSLATGNARYPVSTAACCCCSLYCCVFSIFCNAIFLSPHSSLLFQLSVLQLYNILIIIIICRHCYGFSGDNSSKCAFTLQFALFYSTVVPFGWAMILINRYSLPTKLPSLALHSVCSYSLPIPFTPPAIGSPTEISTDRDLHTSSSWTPCLFTMNCLCTDPTILYYACV